MSIRSFLQALTPSSFWCRPFIYPSISLLLILFFSISLVEPAKAQAQPESSIRPELVADINSDTPGSNPRSLVEMEGMVYFSAYNRAHGNALWKSDGTDAGTQLVKESFNVDDIATVNGRLVILATAVGMTDGLWLSDGTAAGTVLVDFDGLVGSYWNSPALFVVNNYVYFGISKDSSVELWRTDGTVTGTIRLLELESGPDFYDMRRSMRLRQGDQMGGKFYFFVTEYDPNVEEIINATIWESDGTVVGTIPAVTVGAVESGWAVTAGTDAFYFVTFNTDANSATIWKSDGTQANTALVKEITPNFPLRPTSWEDTVWNEMFYVGIRQTDLYAGEFWKSDGTTDGTVMIDEICARNFFPFDDSLFFAGDVCDGTYEGGPFLWKTDGTKQGTVEVKDVSAEFRLAHPHPFLEMNDHLYFIGHSAGVGYSLWRSDGTTEGTAIVSDAMADIYTRDAEDLHFKVPRPRGIRQAVVLEDKIYFSAVAPGKGSELHSSDGTREGTQLVKDIYDSQTFSSFPELITALGDLVCLRTVDRELKCSDDNIEQFQSVSGYWGWDPYENAIAATTSHLYWVTNDQLWRTDGTELGTFQIEFDIGGQINIGTLESVGEKLLFHRGGRWWITDGTMAGTQFSDIGVVSHATLGNDLYFVGSRIDDEGTGYDGGLWKSNRKLDAPVKISSDPQIHHLVASETMLYFLANSGPQTGQYELWTSDGTNDGANKIADISFPQGGYQQPEKNWLVDQDTIYFVATDEEHGIELWKSDGTSDGTNIIIDLIPGAETAYPLLLTASDGEIYFTTLSQSNNSAWELWKSDGTAEGTRLVDKFTGFSSPYYVGTYGTSVSPFNIKAEYWNGYLVMMLQRQTSDTDIYGDTVFQSELWVSKGMAESTKRVLITDSDSCRDENENPRPCSLMLHPTRNQVFFTAFDDTHGYELWTLVDDSTEPATPTPTNTSEPTPTPTSTPEPVEPTNTPTLVPSNTPTPVPSNTPTPIPPDTPTPISTTTPEPTSTPIVETPAPTVEPVPETPTPTSEPVGCGPLEQEAEAGELSGKWIVGDDVIASGGQYITIPDTDEVNAAAVNPNSASYCFTVNEGGTYRLLGWVYAADEQDNSLFVSLDGQLLDGQPLDEFAWELPISMDYTADYANSRGGDDPVEFTLEPGEQTVTLSLREDGLRVDKLALVRIDGSQPVLAPPMPASCAPMGSEAEDGTFYGNFAVGNDEDASGGQFISVPDVLRSGNTALQQQPNSRHRVDYCITVADAGDYRLRTEVHAPDYKANSFFVQINGAPEAAHLYDVYPIGETYFTDYVNDRNGADPVIYSLDAGPHVVSFILREDGTRLDSFTLESVNAQVASTMSPTPLQVEENDQAEEGTAEIKLYLPLLQ